MLRKKLLPSPFKTDQIDASLEIMNLRKKNRFGSGERIILQMNPSKIISIQYMLV